MSRGSGTITGLVRMAPGTRLPCHRHVTAEQLYMLSGDAQISGGTLGAGDDYRTMASTSHDVTPTSRSCEFLLISSGVEVLGKPLARGCQHILPLFDGDVIRAPAVPTNPIDPTPRCAS